MKAQSIDTLAAICSIGVNIRHAANRTERATVHSVASEAVALAHEIQAAIDAEYEERNQAVPKRTTKRGFQKKQ